MDTIVALIDQALDAYRHREMLSRQEWLDTMLDLRLAATALDKELTDELIPQRDDALVGSDLSVS